jgi:hypothetical protein
LIFRQHKKFNQKTKPRKTMKMKKMAVLSAVTAGLLWGAAADAQVFNYNPGDLLLGFRTSGASDLVVDIGSSSLYTGGVGPFIISGPGGLNLYTSQQFSDAGLNINNLYFSVFGVSPLTSRNLWMSDVSSNSAWTAHGVGSQGATAGVITSIANGAADISSQSGAGVDNTTTAVVVPSSYNSSGDTSYTVGIGSSGNLQGYFQGDIEGTTAVYDGTNYVASSFSSGSTPIFLDLYELDTANSGNAGKLVGDFELDPNGTLTFDPAPEPATWATLGAGMMLLAAVRRFRRTA